MKALDGPVRCCRGDDERFLGFRKLFLELRRGAQTELKPVGKLVANIVKLPAPSSSASV